MLPYFNLKMISQRLTIFVFHTHLLKHDIFLHKLYYEKIFSAIITEFKQYTQHIQHSREDILQVL